MTHDADDADVDMGRIQAVVLESATFPFPSAHSTLPIPIPSPLHPPVPTILTLPFYTSPIPPLYHPFNPYFYFFPTFSPLKQLFEEVSVRCVIDCITETNFIGVFKCCYLFILAQKPLTYCILIFVNPSAQYFHC